MRQVFDGLARIAQFARVHAVHPVEVYYEDTDFSGVVYHPNYLRYFERAREHMLGREVLLRLWHDEGVGFVVYKAEMTFKEGAEFGDLLEVRSTPTLESEYRVIFQQQIFRGDALLVDGLVHLVCVGRDRKLVKLPSVVIEGLR